MSLKKKPISEVLLSIAIVLFLSVMNLYSAVLCCKPDGNISFEKSDAHGNCEPCESSANNKDIHPKNKCVDVSFTNFVALPHATAGLWKPKTTSLDASNTLLFVTWFADSLKNTLLTDGRSVLPAAAALPPSPYFERSVILLI